MKYLAKLWANEYYFQPTLVALRSKGRVCGLSHSGIAGCLSVVSVVFCQVEVSATG